ncbi:MAG: hypothetical protein SGJ20_21065 [Planctomycetota bacterium]|nr:hypothetical protein [Planctomycetota bacterium]
MFVSAVGRADIPPLKMPNRFRTDIAYFMTPALERGAPKLPEGEYWIHADDVQRWLESGVLEVVSPLDSMNMTEFEITEEQEAWLRWLVANGVQHVRVDD